jgi:NAD(P)-dependent dehydrogenase (short-subunit alcohol dehydrogenase family)
MYGSLKVSGFNTTILNSSVYDEATSLAGKSVAITGGNTGLGKETAVKLAALGADVIILCRNPTNAQAAVAEIKERSG